MIEIGQICWVVRVGRVVDEVRFLGSRGVTAGAFGETVEALGAIGRELRNCDSSENTDDRDDDEQLDEREAELVLLVNDFSPF